MNTTVDRDTAVIPELTYEQALSTMRCSEFMASVSAAEIDAARSVLAAAGMPQAEVCRDCHGTGEYVRSVSGPNTEECDCARCDGVGVCSGRDNRRKVRQPVRWY